MAKKASAKGKKKKQIKDSTGNLPKGFSNLAEKWLPLVMFIAVALLLLIGPFQRGLFFPSELLIAKACVFALLMLWGYFRLLKKDSRLFFGTPLDLCLGILLLAYLLSLFFAVHQREALEEVLKVTSYLVIYLVVFDLCRYMVLPGFLKPGSGNGKMGSKKTENSAAGNSSSTAESGGIKPASSGSPAGEDRIKTVPAAGKNPLISPEADAPGVSLILHLLLLAAVVVTVASLGVPAGHWDFPGAYADERIASPMGYANTAAAYLMTAFLLALGLAPLAAKWWQRTLYLAPAAIMLFTVVLTFSRGAWVLLPPLCLLLVLLAAPGERLRSLLYLAAASLAAVPAALLADPVYRSDAPAMAWLLVIAAALAAVLLGMAVELYLNLGRKVRLAIGGGTVLAAAAALFIIFILPALGPVHLERGPDQAAETKTVEQIISDPHPETDYRLTLEVKAEESPAAASEADYAWGVKVIGGLPDYKDEELFDHRADATEGWETKEYSFKTGPETERLEVLIYNHYPGTSVSARNVTLSAAGEEHNLTFALHRMLPDRFYDRIFSVSLDRNVDARFEFMGDAVKVIGDYPVTGIGGGGWNAVYRAYQETPYNTTEVHNHFLQVWIEAGIFGFLAFLGIWVSCLAAFIRNCFIDQATPRRWQFWTASFVPVAALGAHSVIDWNFSMAAVGIFLFVLLGANRSLDRINWFARLKIKTKDSKQTKGRGLLIGGAALVLGLFLLVYSLLLLDGLHATWRSQEAAQRGNLEAAQQEARRAISRDPYRADNYYNLSLLKEEQARQAGVQENMEKVIELARQAYEREPYNPRYVMHYGSLLLHNVGVEEGLAHIDRLMELRPFSESSYIQAASSRLQLASFYLNEGADAQARRYLRDVQEIEEKMTEKLGHSEPLAFAMGRTHEMLGNRARAVEYLESIEEDEDMYEEAQELLQELQD